MAGMRVVIVECDAQGNVDIDDLRLKAERHARGARRADGHLPVHARRVRAEHRRDLRLVHEHGGQVYLDGANMNALVGIARRASSAPTSRT
jgi:glycine dehydrogenase